MNRREWMMTGAGLTAGLGLAWAFARPEGEKGPVYYAKGWIVRPFAKGKMSVWHEGTIEGSSCMLVRRADGVTFAAMFNTRQKVGKTEAIGVIELPIHEAANAVFYEKK